MPKVILSQGLLATVNELHRRVGNSEWSGILFYEVIRENEDINDSVYLAKYFHLMDIGSSGYTEYNMSDPSIWDMYDRYPDILDKGMRIGHLHTHHNMSIFFSGTDMSELRENASGHLIYLSLIVGFDCKYLAKLGIFATVDREQKITLNNGVQFITNLKEKKVIDIDCEIEIEGLQFTETRYDELVKRKQDKLKSHRQFMLPSNNTKMTIDAINKLNHFNQTFDDVINTSPVHYDEEYEEISPELMNRWRSILLEIEETSLKQDDYDEDQIIEILNRNKVRHDENWAALSVMESYFEKDQDNPLIDSMINFIYSLLCKLKK